VAKDLGSFYMKTFFQCHAVNSYSLCPQQHNTAFAILFGELKQSSKIHMTVNALIVQRYQQLEVENPLFNKILNDK